MSKIILALVFAVTACAHNRYTVQKADYDQSTLSSADTGAAVSVLEFLGYDIAKVKDGKVITEWEIMYLGRTLKGRSKDSVPTGLLKDRGTSASVHRLLLLGELTGLLPSLRRSYRTSPGERYDL
jgi:hypothetical protein